MWAGPGPIFVSLLRAEFRSGCHYKPTSIKVANKSVQQQEIYSSHGSKKVTWNICLQASTWLCSFSAGARFSPLRQVIAVSSRKSNYRKKKLLEEHLYSCKLLPLGLDYGNPRSNRWLGVGLGIADTVINQWDACVLCPEFSEGRSSARCWPQVLVAGRKAALNTEERTLAPATFTPFWRARIRPHSAFIFLWLEADLWVFRVIFWAFDWPRPQFEWLEKIWIQTSLIKKHKWKFQSRNGWTVTNWLIGSLWFVEPNVLIIPRRDP